MISDKTKRWLLGIVLAGYVLLAAVAARFVAFNVTRDYPLEYREDAMVLSTALLVEGKNPYDLEHHPVYINDYGILYNAATWPFVEVFGHTRLVHRLVSVAFIVLACAVLVWALRADGVSRTMSLAPALALFACLAAGLSIVARPDSLGLFLFLASVVIPHRFGFRRGSLVACAVLSILGFLAKPYFLLGAPCVALYVFLFESKGRGLRFAAAFAAGMIVTILVVHALFETYFTNTVFIHGNFSWASFTHLKTVAKQYLFLNAGFLALAVWGWGFLCARREHEGVASEPDDASSEKPGLRFRDPHAPLVTAAVPFPLFMLLAGAATIVGKLGLHPGNGILYYHQLVTPFLLWCVFALADRRLGNRAPALALILLNLFILFWKLDFPIADHTHEYKALAHMTAPQENVFHPPLLAHALRSQGKGVYDAGQTEYWPWGRAHNVCSNVEEYVQRGEQHADRVAEAVRERRFDLVIVTRGLCPLLDPGLLAENYVLSDTRTLGTLYRTWPVEIWTPKPKTDAAERRSESPG